jgi:hypothetical protein
MLRFLEFLAWIIFSLVGVIGALMSLKLLIDGVSLLFHNPRRRKQRDAKRPRRDRHKSSVGKEKRGTLP